MKNYINKTAEVKLNNASVVLNESFFDLDVYLKQEDFNQAISFIKNENKKIISELEKEVKKASSKKAQEYMKKSDINYLYIIEDLSQLKEFCQMTGVNYNHWKKESPFFTMLEFQPDGYSKKDSVKVFAVNSPKITFLERFFSKRHISGSLFPHKLWKELEFYFFMYHELMEAKEEINIFNKKSTSNGNIGIIYNKKRYTVGNHNSLMVLAYEACILNKFSNFKLFQKFKNVRLTEYNIIKEKTGVNLWTLKKITPEVRKKLNSVKDATLNLDDEKLRKKMNSDQDSIKKLIASKESPWKLLSTGM